MDPTASLLPYLPHYCVFAGPELTQNTVGRPVREGVSPLSSLFFPLLSHHLSPMSTPQQSPAPVVASAPPAASSLPELPATSVPVPALGEAAFPTTTPILPVAPFMGGAPGIPPLNLTGDAAVSQPIMSMPASGVMAAFPFTFSIPGAPSFINNVPQARGTLRLCQRKSSLISW